MLPTLGPHGLHMLPTPGPHRERPEKRVVLLDVRGDVHEEFLGHRHVADEDAAGDLPRVLPARHHVQEGGLARARRAH